ncbi:ATP-grasp domain-containing protein [Streptomyces chrestomyceticus]|uniref:ATP-grasp domain-containing protein n=1 Tax=Streptomyces chrestomyceticus TaxID=68185 RepID=A0ABU7WJU6_9ACTN
MAHVLFVEPNVPAVDAMRRAMELGHRVSLIRSNTFRFYPDDAATDAVLTSLDRCVDIPDTADPDQLARALGPIAETDRPDAVISQIEFTVEATAIACARVGLPFTDADGVRNARDKAHARDLLAAAGLATARHRHVTRLAQVREALDRVGLPVVIKPVTGADSILADRADTVADALTAAERALTHVARLPEMLQEQFGRGIIVEEHLAGPLVSAEVGALNGRFHRFMLSGRPRSRQNECIEMGASMPAEVSAAQREACFAYAEDVCRTLGLDLGIFHIEMILTARGPVLVEANPRLMGGVMPGLYKMVTGQDIHDYEIRIHLGQDIDGPLPPWGDHFVTSRKLMPRRGARLADTVDLGWLDAYSDRLNGFFPYRLAPGSEVAQDEILARYTVRDRSMASATEIADDLLDRFEKCLGISLIH